MKLGLVQIGSIAGDLEGNVDRCLAGAREAAADGADLIVLPAMAVPGSMPRDILLDETFIEAVREATEDLAERTRDLPPIIVGTVVPGGRETLDHPGLLRVAVVLDKGEITAVVGQQRLASQDVFFERRWFVPDGPSRPLDIAGYKVGLLLDNDLLADKAENPAAHLIGRGAELLICLAASPYRRGTGAVQLERAAASGVPTVVINSCGAADDLVFDGRSFILGREGKVTAQLAHCREEILVVDLEGGLSPVGEPLDWEEEVWEALKLGVHGFVDGNGMDRVVLGLSGGIDSALTAVLACEALGAGRVTAIAIPSRFTDERSTTSARQLADTLGMRFEVVELDLLHQAAESALGALVDGGVGAENLQARLRMLILTTWVNRFGGLLLNTSNKTELSLGYGTLYGDLAGSLSPLGDLTKTEVYALARWLNRGGDVIPNFILDRSPTAE
ncbi:MAG: NAD(+) synthase, partial [Acidobacteria bacterium]|nr:NAD(+) synthase [Acidobacteriota bacterium]